MGVKKLHEQLIQCTSSDHEIHAKLHDAHWLLWEAMTYLYTIGTGQEGITGHFIYQCITSQLKKFFIGNEKAEGAVIAFDVPALKVYQKAREQARRIAKRPKIDPYPKSYRIVDLGVENEDTGEIELIDMKRLLATPRLKCQIGAYCWSVLQREGPSKWPSHTWMRWVFDTEEKEKHIFKGKNEEKEKEEEENSVFLSPHPLEEATIVYGEAEMTCIAALQHLKSVVGNGKIIDLMTTDQDLLALALLFLWNFQPVFLLRWRYRFTTKSVKDPNALLLNPLLFQLRCSYPQLTVTQFLTWIIFQGTDYWSREEDHKQVFFYMSDEAKLKSLLLTVAPLVPENVQWSLPLYRTIIQEVWSMFEMIGKRTEQVKRPSNLHSDEFLQDSFENFEFNFLYWYSLAYENKYKPLWN